MEGKVVPTGNKGADEEGGELSIKELLTKYGVIAL